MTPDQSTTARPWFLPPSWARIVPLLVHTIATDPESDEARAAAHELTQLGIALDGWNERAPQLLAHLDSASSYVEMTDAAAPFLLAALRLIQGDK